MPGFPIAPLRKFSESLMTDVTQVLRFTETETEAGYPRPVWATVSTTVSYGTDLSANEQIVANQAGYHASAKRYLPFGTDVTVADRLQVGTKVYEIASMNSETTPGLTASVELLVSRTA